MGKFDKQGKTAQLNIRLTPQQHAAIAARAAACYMDMTAYLLNLVQRDMLNAEFSIEVPVFGQKGD